jgi:hypothetical protein
VTHCLRLSETIQNPPDVGDVAQHKIRLHEGFARFRNRWARLSAPQEIHGLSASVARQASQTAGPPATVCAVSSSTTETMTVEIGLFMRGRHWSAEWRSDVRTESR